MRRPNSSSHSSGRSSDEHTSEVRPRKTFKANGTINAESFDLWKELQDMRGKGKGKEKVVDLESGSMQTPVDTGSPA